MRQEVKDRVSRALFGPPKRSDQAHHERLGVFLGLAVFSADALSSVAYATEEILYVLVGTTAAASANGVFSLPVGLGIVLLVLIVAASYQQTLHAYPTGGGSYIVATDNLGHTAGLIAGGALLVDYILTVAVSSAAGMDALVSAVPSLKPFHPLLILASIWFITWMNMRGVKESGTIFAVPVYGFVLATALVLIGGAYQTIIHHALVWHPTPLAAHLSYGFTFSWPTGITLFILLKAFSSGCTALTGLEAVSNGIQAFKQPEVETAAATMKWERTILYAMFAGITLLAFGFDIHVSEHETVLSQIAAVAFGGRNVLYYFTQIMTMLILVLAANTAFADFPRLSSIIARDGYLPRKFAHRGDQLVYRHGIVTLAGISSLLVLIFKDVHSLIPLYAVGVFVAFTLSQTGMVVHWFKQTGVHSLTGAIASGKLKWWPVFINSIGALICAVVSVVIAWTKFFGGAWLVVVIVPVIVVYFLSVKRYYRRFQVSLDRLKKARLPIDAPTEVRVILAIGGVNPVADHALRVAKHMSSDVTAVFVAEELADAQHIRTNWEKRYPDTPLVILDSPYRSVVSPLRDYVHGLLRSKGGEVVHLMMPVVVTNQHFDKYLHNGTADQLIQELRFTPGLLITEIPFQVDINTPGGLTPVRA